MQRNHLQREPRLLAVAYWAMPDAGSEAGAGWVWSRLLATFGETWVLTLTPDPDAQALREDRLRELGIHDRLHFINVDLPAFARKWRVKGASKGTRFQRVEYILWQMAALRQARRLHRSVGFDLAWHLTWASTWGSLVAFLPVPYVLGPIGGGVQPPWRLLADLGVRGALWEVVRATAQYVIRYANPVGLRTWNEARLILVQNPETRAWLPDAVRARTVIFPNAVLELAASPRDRRRHEPPRAMFAGVLLPLKGVSLAIRSIALLPRWELIICGDGPDAGRLRSLAERLGVGDRVTFLGWRPRAEVIRLMQEEADVFLFPSLHDEGSWVTAEAIAVGLPVVCLDRGGPPVIAGHGVPPTTRSATVRALAAALRIANGSAPPPVRTFAFDTRREALADVLSTFRVLSSLGGGAGGHVESGASSKPHEDPSV